MSSANESEFKATSNFSGFIFENAKMIQNTEFHCIDDTEHVTYIEHIFVYKMLNFTCKAKQETKFY